MYLKRNALPRTASRTFLGLVLICVASACATSVRNNGLKPRTEVARATSPSLDASPFGEFEPARYRVFETSSTRPLPPMLARPTNVACSFENEVWFGPIHLSADAEAIAEVTNVENMRVDIPEGLAQQGAFATFDIVGMKLAATVTAQNLSFYLKRPALLGGYAWTRVDTEWHWEQASRDRITLELTPDPRVRPTNGVPRLELACHDVTLDPGDVEAYDELLHFASRKTVLEAQWLGAEGVPLSLKPGGPPVALLDTRPVPPAMEPDIVAILDARGAFRRIIHSVDSIVLVGWVPATALRRHVESAEWSNTGLLYRGVRWGAPNSSPEDESDPTRSLEQTRVLAGAEPVCAWNSPLIVESGGLVRSLGTLARAISLVPGSRRDGWREVDLHHPNLTANANVKFWVPEQFLYPCGQTEPSDLVGASR